METDSQNPIINFSPFQNQLQNLSLNSNQLQNLSLNSNHRVGFKRITDFKAHKQIVDQNLLAIANSNPENNTNNRIKLVTKATRNLATFYHSCNPAFDWRKDVNPRRVLTKPSRPVLNDGYDNEDNDYILYVNDILGSKEHQQYQILDILGQGTFGQVVKCVNLKTKVEVAIKVIKNKPAYYNQSLVEVAILDILNNKHDPEDKHHILRMKDTFVHRSHLCITFEVLSLTLYDLIKQSRFAGFSLNLVKVFTGQILDALTVLLKAGIIHCDLKPENILLKSLNDPTIKVIDFGSACHQGQTLYTYIQSRFYRSPEVLLGVPYTASIDMWSVGCIVAELFLGLPLFPGTSEYNQLSRIVETMGVPPIHMIEKGKAAKNFFEPVSTDLVGQRQQYQLKSMEKYQLDSKTKEGPSKRYLKGIKLEEVIMQHEAQKRGVTLRPEDAEADRQSRLVLIDFLYGLLNMNPLERWSPQQAKMHPFITGQPFTGPFQPSQIRSQPRIPQTPLMNVASQLSHDYSLPSHIRAKQQLDQTAPPPAIPNNLGSGGGAVRISTRQRANTLNSSKVAVPATLQRLAHFTSQGNGIGVKGLKKSGDQDRPHSGNDRGSPYGGIKEQLVYHPKGTTPLQITTQPVPGSTMFQNNPSSGMMNSPIVRGELTHTQMRNSIPVAQDIFSTAGVSSNNRRRSSMSKTNMQHPSYDSAYGRRASLSKYEYSNQQVFQQQSSLHPQYLQSNKRTPSNYQQQKKSPSSSSNSMAYSPTYSQVSPTSSTGQLIYSNPSSLSSSSMIPPHIAMRNGRSGSFTNIPSSPSSSLSSIPIQLRPQQPHLTPPHIQIPQSVTQQQYYNKSASKSSDLYSGTSPNSSIYYLNKDLAQSSSTERVVDQQQQQQSPSNNRSSFISKGDFLSSMAVEVQDVDDGGGFQPQLPSNAISFRQSIDQGGLSPMIMSSRSFTNDRGHSPSRTSSALSPVREKVVDDEDVFGISQREKDNMSPVVSWDWENVKNPPPPPTTTTQKKKGGAALDHIVTQTTQGLTSQQQMMFKSWKATQNGPGSPMDTSEGGRSWTEANSFNMRSDEKSSPIIQGTDTSSPITNTGYRSRGGSGGNQNFQMNNLPIIQGSLTQQQHLLAGASDLVKRLGSDFSAFQIETVDGVPVVVDEGGGIDDNNNI